MKGKIATILATLVIAAICITGCSGRIDYSLPDNPIEFNSSAFVNPTNAEDEYAAIEYKGRIYIPFGTLKGSLNNSDVGECLGFLVQDGQKLESVRILTLTSDDDVNFLLEQDTEGEMSQASFYRAVDTVGKEITIPAFIESLDYDYWR